MNRASDVLDLSFAPVLESDIEFVAHLVAHDPADADPTGLGQGFEARSDIDAIAKDVVVVDNDVADIDADAELDAALGRHSDITLGHLALHLYCAAHRIHDAGKLDEQPIAHSLDEAPMMFLDFGISELAAQLFQRGERPLLIGAHQARVADYIGSQYCGKTAGLPHNSPAIKERAEHPLREDIRGQS
ncbi:MAG TPA: hypothetical protein VHY80_12295 [Stellaceae bacterium]|nr:hypothetical protein [Stellaceae bacterium]